jgi:chromosomal replication initiator protein
LPKRRLSPVSATNGAIANLPFTTSFRTSQTFENYTVAAFNQFAFTAAHSLCQDGKSNFNPLFIEGAPGLGKTHLLNAIGNGWPASADGGAVYLNCQEHLEQLSSLPANMPQMVWQSLALVGVILVDNVHLLPPEASSQQFLLEIFNRCYHAQKQMVFAANLLPYQISDLNAGLRSRLGCGLIARIRKPDARGFQEVLEGMLTAADLPISPEVSEFFGQQSSVNFHAIQDSARRLQKIIETEGDLRKLAKKSLSREDSSSDIPEILTVRTVQKQIGTTYGISPEALSGVAKSHPLVFARQVGMYLTRKLTGMTYAAIGDAFGGRDHSTVIYACRKVRAEMRRNKAIAEEVVEIEKKVLAVCKK